MDEDEHLPTRKKPKPKLLGRGGAMMVKRGADKQGRMFVLTMAKQGASNVRDGSCCAS